MSTLLDANGCLTDEGLAALGSAEAGAAPPELAQHVAACARCQARWLESTHAERKSRLSPEEAARRRWVLTSVVLGMILFALAALVFTLRRIVGG